MKRYISSCLLYIFITNNLFTQTIEPSTGIAKNNLQLEFETLYSVEKEALQKTTSWNIPNILIRYGLSENIELQLHTPFTKERCFEDNELIESIFKFDEIEIGLSLNLWEQKNLIPEAALMARIISSTNNLNLNNLGSIISLNFSNSISEKLCLNYNIGTTTNLNKTTTGFYIVNLSYEPSSKIHFFIENLSDFTFNKTESNCLGAGFGFNLKGNLAIDFSIDKSLKHNLIFTGAILTWVINTKKS
jgi:hypothetical protein